MNDSIFGKIIRGEIPATKVYEDEKCLAFMDINPVTKGHILLIPKEHYTWMHEAPDELVSYLFIKTKELMQAMISGIPCDFVQIGVVGNEVPHFHIHLIPRMLTDDIKHTFSHQSYAGQEEMGLFAEKIKVAVEKAS